MSSSSLLGRPVALLDEDPDLAAGLPVEQFEAARRRAVAPVIEIEGRTWDVGPLTSGADASWLGLFVLSGLLLRRVTVGRRSACELFGHGDVIRPWDTDGGYEPVAIEVDWPVLLPTRVAVLDGAFQLRIARWPALTSQIVARVAQRARYLAIGQAITHLPRAHERLLILFRLLAERWGRVSPAGITVRLPVTHEVLAMLVGAQRPTVTLALQRLTRAGLLIREESDTWLLTNAAIEWLKRRDGAEAGVFDAEQELP